MLKEPTGAAIIVETDSSDCEFKEQTEVGHKQSIQYSCLPKGIIWNDTKWILGSAVKEWETPFNIWNKKHKAEVIDYLKNYPSQTLIPLSRADYKSYMVLRN